MIRDQFEKIAQMDITTWVSMLMVAFSATLVRLLVELNNFSIREFVVGSILAVFLAYITVLYCMEIEMSGKMMGVTVGFTTYQATNILTGIGKLGATFAKDPIALFTKIKEALKK